MSKSKKYIFNPLTLTYEESVQSRVARIIQRISWIIACIGAVGFYWWIYCNVLDYDLPKTAYLKQINDGWSAKIEIIDRNIEEYEAALKTLQTRDDDVYRSIFGMNPIPKEVRNAGFGGVNRYSYLDEADHSGHIKNTMMRLDILTKKSYVQSRSYDDVEAVAKRADDMASCIPNISPIVPDKKKYRLSSGFGQRTDPITGRLAIHAGMDFALPVGSSVYATGDGVVSKVVHSKTGYGNYILIDHGFGYKTRYAHLSTTFVEEGMSVKRGDFLGKSGNSGKSSGPHLHYEVIYRDRAVNPYNYVDLDISVEEYSSMLRHVEAESGEYKLHPSHSNK